MNNEYTLKEVVEAFGMKEETILKWIEDGKLEGVQYIEDKWVFDIDSKWASMPGKQILIKEIIASHNRLNEDLIEMNNNTYENLILNLLYSFQEKYDGTYEETLKNKSNKNWEEKEDEKTWIFYLDKINILENMEDYKNEPEI